MSAHGTTLPDQLLHLFSKPPSDLYVAPGIPEKKLKGARSYADWGAETPLLLFDNTVFGSAKNGVVITESALYTDTYRGRVDLSLIRSMPVYKEYEGTLQTQIGPIQLTKMSLDEAQDALLHALETIIAFNSGVRVAPASGPPVPGKVGELAFHFLRAATKLEMGTRAPRRKLMNAAAASAEWLDTLAGERLVAYGDETVMGKGDEYVVLTDRRLIAHLHGTQTVVPYSALLGARTQKITLATKLVMDLASGTAEVEMIQTEPDAGLVAPFLSYIAALPYGERGSPKAELATPDDPSGASALLQQLEVPDPRLPILLRLVQAGLAGGAMSPAAAADHVERVRLFAANSAAGRGVCRGMRVSPLHGEDLAAVLGETLGVCLQSSGDENSRYYDYRLSQGGSVGRAAASTAVGLAALAIVGVGWVSRPGSRTTVLRAMLRHLGSATGFGVFDIGAQKQLHEEDQEMFAGLLESVAAAEPVILLGRILWGWNAPVAMLTGTPPHAFANEVARAVGPTDLTPFFARAT